jgi:3-oxoacyl-(acyl-carrier-protein) synthase
VTTLRYGLGAADFSINAASATGAQAVFLAGTMIRAGLADLVLAVASDSSLPSRLNETMQRNGSVAKNCDSLPLGISRSGMRPAEGAACLIMESESHLLARGGKPVAEWLGGSCLNESRHLMAPDDSSMVLEEAFRNLMRDHFSPDEQNACIDWISLHATGTSRFDKAEIGCLKRLYSERLPWISAFKRITGHSLGASGLIEAALLAEGLNVRAVPPWPSGIDPSLKVADMKPSEIPRPRTALQIAQGMGGSLVLNLFTAP